MVKKDKMRTTEKNRVNTKKVLVFPYLLQRLRTNKGKLSFLILRVLCVDDNVVLAN